jgi:uncharacterized SAM-binding protein YcdF (DUF218 family)/glycosyltransferase involved in cell wall biosynthesis
MKGKQNYIIISSVDWSTHWQMHHQLATSLIEAGHRVLFIENTGVRSPQIKDYGRIWERISNWRKSTKGFREIRSNLFVYSPLFIPFPYSKIAKFINRFLLSNSIQKWLRAADFYETILITFLPTPLTLAFIEDIQPVLTIYYCANDMAGSSPATRFLRTYEDQLFASADLVFVISSAIKDRAVKFSKKVYYFPPGVDYSKFEAERLTHKNELPDMKALKTPIIGYVGALSGVLDQDLLCEMAKQMPQASIVIVGPKHTNTSRMESMENIYLLGEKPHDLMPAYINSFDVSLIPYIKTEFTDSVYSCKLNEYLSMGVPVVTTNLREFRHFKEQYGDVLKIGEDNNSFIDSVSQYIKESSVEERNRRIEVAKLNSWDSRFNGIVKLIDVEYQTKIETKKDWQKKFLQLYRKGQLSLMKLGFSLILIYISLFHTPLIWFLSRPLTIQSTAKKADAIVVFGGYGEIGWVNSGFQRRVKEALNLYNRGYAPVIIISSGENYDFREIDLMRAVLKDSGVPGEDIIPDFGAGSTYESVMHTSKIIQDRNYKSILLISSKYHMKRAVLTWNKNVPSIQIIPCQFADSGIVWGASYNEIKTISYEYLAILHNWILGRI